MTTPYAVVRLEDALIEGLRSLPDPGAPMKGGVRAADQAAVFLALQRYGYAENRNGWWRKTKTGVLYLREVDRASGTAPSADRAG